MLSRLFPSVVDNVYRGHVLAILLLVPILIMKLAMSSVAIFNPRFGAETADGIPVSTFGARGEQEFLELFAILGLAQFTLAAMAVIALIRYRAMIPMMFLILAAEQLCRRFLLMKNPIPWFPDPPQITINLVILVGLFVGFVLPLIGNYPAADGEHDGAGDKP